MCKGPVQRVVCEWGESQMGQGLEVQGSFSWASRGSTGVAKPPVSVLPGREAHGI